MAPRRGGGGGGISIGSSCSSGAFQETYSQAFVACFAIFIIGFFGLLVAFITSRKKHAAAKNILTWQYAGLSILLTLCNFITHLIILVLGECDTVDSLELFKARIATQIFSGLADVALLGAILLPLTSYLQILIGANPKAVKIIHSVVVGIISLLMVVYIGISSYNYGDYEAIMYSDTQNLFDVANKLGVAVYVLYMLAVVLASVANLITLLQFNSKRVAAGSLNALVPLLCLCMLLWSILIVVLSVYYGLQSHNLTMAGDIAFQYIINTSYFLVFVFLILIAGSNTVAAAVAPQTATQPVYSPVPVYGGTAQPQYGVPQAGYQSPPPQAGYQSLQPQSYTGYQPPPQQVNAYQAPVQQYQQPYQQPYQNP